MGAIETIALAMGVGWAAGINLYAAIATLGLLQLTGNIALPPELAVVADPLVLSAAVVMYCVEFFADKVPGVDTGWDALHTFIRIPAGAVLAATAIGDVSMPAQIAAAIVGGSLAGASHLTKAGSRVMINTSPEPVSNWTVSIAEDLAVVAGLWAALTHPELFLVFLVLFVLLAAWLLPRIWRGILAVGGALRRWIPAARPPLPAAADGEPGELRFSLRPRPPGDVQRR